MKNTDTSQLPANIEEQLSDLENRHKRHQEKMEEQHGTTLSMMEQLTTWTLSTML